MLPAPWDHGALLAKSRFLTLQLRWPNFGLTVYLFFAREAISIVAPLSYAELSSEMKIFRQLLFSGRSSDMSCVDRNSPNSEPGIQENLSLGRGKRGGPSDSPQIQSAAWHSRPSATLTFAQ